MADFYEKDGRKDEALKIREESVVLSRKLKGAEHRDRLQGLLSAAMPASPS